jgi:hypothetical protein
MAAKKAAAKKKTESKPAAATLEFNAEDGHYYLKQGRVKTDVGRSRRYAEKLLADTNG